MNLHYKNGYSIFLFRICSAFSSNDQKNAPQHLKNNTFLQLSMLSKQSSLKFKQILAKQTAIPLIYATFLVFFCYFIFSQILLSQRDTCRDHGDSTHLHTLVVSSLLSVFQQTYILQVRSFAVQSCELFKHQI